MLVSIKRRLFGTGSDSDPSSSSHTDPPTEQSHKRSLSFTFGDARGKEVVSELGMFDSPVHQTRVKPSSRTTPRSWSYGRERLGVQVVRLQRPYSFPQTSSVGTKDQRLLVQGETKDLPLLLPPPPFIPNSHPPVRTLFLLLTPSSRSLPLGVLGSIRRDPLH